MPNPEKYTNFKIVGNATRVLATSAGEHGVNVLYACIQCPYCSEKFEMPSDSVKKNKSSRCLEHLRACDFYDSELKPISQKRRKPSDVVKPDGENLITVYKLVFKREGRAVYTGRTKNTEARLKQHASRSSGCRLVRNAIRRYGIDQFVIEPIVKCQPADADANESYYIMANNTLYPNGYNLRHGSKAGDESDDETRIATSTSGIVPFANVNDELHAHMEATGDLAEICEDLEDCSAMDEVVRDLLREVHPDRAGDRSFSANEVTTMLNAVRESVRE